MILIDYHCVACDYTFESLVPSPPAAQQTCSKCGMESVRRYTAAGLSGRARWPAAGSTACVDNPDVPGLCHVGTAAKRSLIARHRGDDDTLAAEQARQQSAYERNGPPRSAAIQSHSHTPGHR